MEQYTNKQYDDDLTIGNEEYDDSYYTGAEELFEVPTDYESPISRLKSLILSIDWEITDEVLLLFNEELVSLRDLWAGEKIKLVYVQALEKISKYIYYKKADSHPSAIKLLLTLYHNLEKIVSSEDLTEAQKKEILFEDVRRFEQLKAHIKKEGLVAPQEDIAVAEPEEIDAGQAEELRNLKAIVLGIDWEITDNDLNELQQEVSRLEGLFAGNKPRLILLQGLGTLGAYIKMKKSNAHAEAFKVLHIFVESLEQIVSRRMSLDEEKEVLFPAVERFNSFKTLIGTSISKEDEDVSPEDEEVYEEPTGEGGVIAPAFADIPEDEVHGFQAEEEAHALGYESPEDVVSHVADFFPDDTIEAPPRLDEEVAPPAASLEEKVAMEEALSTEPAQLDTGVAEEKPPIAPTGAESVGDDQQADDAVAEMFPETPPSFGDVEAEVALQGVDVETEADDDSDEEGLPQVDGQLAPALSVTPDEEMEAAELEDEKSSAGGDDDEIEGVVADFFGSITEEVEPPAISEPSPEDEEVEQQVALEPAPAEEVEQPAVAEPVLEEEIETGEMNKLAPAQMVEKAFEELPPLTSVDPEIALQGVDVETEADDDTDEEPLPTQGDEIAPALAAEDEESLPGKDAEPALINEEDSNILETVDDFFADELETNELPVADLAADELPAEDLAVDELPAEDLAVDELSVDEMVIDELDTKELVVDQVSADEDLAEAIPAEPLTEEEEIVFAQEIETADEQDVSAFVQELDSFFDEEEPETVAETDLDAILAVDAATGPGELRPAFSELGDLEEEVVFELVDDFVLESLELDTLQGFVDSLGQEGDQITLMDLNSELLKLNDKCAESPVEQTLLNLVSTLAGKYGDLLSKRE